MLTRQDAINIASELYKLMRKDVKTHLTNVVDKEMDTFISHNEAAALLNLSPGTLYHRKDIPFTKTGGKRIYSRLALVRYLNRC